MLSSIIFIHVFFLKIDNRLIPNTNIYYDIQIISFLSFRRLQSIYASSDVNLWIYGLTKSMNGNRYTEIGNVSIVKNKLLTWFSCLCHFNMYNIEVHDQKYFSSHCISDTGQMLHIYESRNPDIKCNDYRTASWWKQSKNDRVKYIL